MTKMKPILFSTPMVQAILEDRKLITRRAIKFKFLPGYNPEWTGYRTVFEYGEFYLANSKGEPATKPVKCPYGKSGDILWTRETWCRGKARNGDNKIIYKADIETDLQPIHDWYPSIHMPKEAARIFLKVKNIRVERLQDITEEQAQKEGIEKSREHHENIANALILMEFEELWNSTIKKKDIDKYGWDANPFVWVIEFERYRGN